MKGVPSNVAHTNLKNGKSKIFRGVLILKYTFIQFLIINLSQYFIDGFN